MLDRHETRKDAVQVAVESAFNHVGQIAGIVTHAGHEITREIGEWATEMFEMREAAHLAEADQSERAGPADAGADADRPRPTPSAPSGRGWRQLRRR